MEQQINCCYWDRGWMGYLPHPWGQSERQCWTWVEWTGWTHLGKTHHVCSSGTHLLIWTRTEINFNRVSENVNIVWKSVQYSALHNTAWKFVLFKSCYDYVIWNKSLNRKLKWKQYCIILGNIVTPKEFCIA